MSCLCTQSEVPGTYSLTHTQLFRVLLSYCALSCMLLLWESRGHATQADKTLKKNAQNFRYSHTPQNAPTYHGGYGRHRDPILANKKTTHPWRHQKMPLCSTCRRFHAFLFWVTFFVKGCCWTNRDIRTRYTVVAVASAVVQQQRDSPPPVQQRTHAPTVPWCYRSSTHSGVIFDHTTPTAHWPQNKKIKNKIKNTCRRITRQQTKQ